jgi:hypothetical protein
MVKPAVGLKDREVTEANYWRLMKGFVVLAYLSSKTVSLTGKDSQHDICDALLPCNPVEITLISSSLAPFIIHVFAG